MSSASNTKLPNQIPNPEFHVECAMCHDSFSATADTLKELVDIVVLHLEEVVRHHEKSHNDFLQRHPESEYKASAILKDYHVHPSAILESKGFRWAIQRLVPFNEILEVIKNQVVPLEPDMEARAKKAIEPLIGTKTS